MLDRFHAYLKAAFAPGGFASEWAHAFERAADLDESEKTLGLVVGAATADRRPLAAVPYAAHFARQEKRAEKACRSAAASTWGPRWQGGWAR